MLLLTFCRIDLSDFKLSRLTWLCLAVQIPGAMLLYYILYPISDVLAQGIFICVYCPTATAAPVITGMLGGSVSRVAAYSLASNIAVAVTAPFVLSMVGTCDMDLYAAALRIVCNVLPLILGPLAAALAIKRFCTPLYSALTRSSGLSFYLWAIALIIVVGRAVSFVVGEPSEAVPMMLAQAIGAGIVCGFQFWLGRRFGLMTGDVVSGGQGLGQKNTVLAIWIALTYLNPLASIAPAAYIAWQNSVNAFQLAVHRRTNAGS